MRFGLPKELINKLISIFAYHKEIEEAVIYGSRAKGNYKEGSDIDLTFLGKNIDSSLLTLLSQKIDELNSPYLFDLSIFDELESLSLKNHIQNYGKIFYKKSGND